MKKVLIALFFLNFSLVSFAKDGSSGCGPGWYIAKDKSILSFALRATTRRQPLKRRNRLK